MPRAPYAMVTAQAVPGNAGVALMARIRGQAFALMTQASVASIAYTVTDLTLAANLGSGTFAVASTIYDSLQQQDGSWTKDSAVNLGQDAAWGYNWKAILPAAAIPVANSGNRMQVDAVFTPVSGEKFRIVFQFPTIKVYA
ncbi:MAG: hypothetical protein K2R98_08530 [Gemmataceae bacterium]|nr:hypothetical protein [Gemmataceae bacterium]